MPQSTVIKNPHANKARVLLVIPTLGQRLDLLEKTLKSLSNQEETVDVILVCPIRNQGSRKLAKQYGASVADDPGSLSAALNVGFSYAKPWHEYACWMGDDDLLVPGSLAKTVQTLDTSPGAVLAYGYCDYVDDNGKRIFTSRAGSLAPWIMTWGPNLVPLIGMLYRMSELKRAGDFDINLKYSMDLDMLLRLRKQGRFVNTHQVLGAFRWHSSSTTVAHRSASLREARQVKRKYLPKFIRPFALVWEIPVEIATQLAARRVTSMAKQSLQPDS